MLLNWFNPEFRLVLSEMLLLLSLALVISFMASIVWCTSLASAMPFPL
jgi:hypothetical protein